MPKADSPTPDDASLITSSASPEPQPRRKSKTSTDNKVSKPRLTAHQKNTNHKDAENKRRNAIRDQFLTLSRIVPGTEGQERSEHVMLQKTVAHLKEVMEERRELVSRIEARGGRVADELKLHEHDWGGKDWAPRGVEEWERIRGIKPGTAAEGEGEDENE